jgi:hypothetical protein
MKVLELKGLNSLYAAQVFHKLMLGLKMLPAYLSESYKDFYDRIDSMEEKDQETMIREAVMFIKLYDDELLDVLRFATDANGVAYGKENSKNLTPAEIHECVVAVCLRIAQEHKINLVSEDEKKNLKISRSTSEKPSTSTPIQH